MCVAKRLKTCGNAEMFSLPLMKPLQVFIKPEPVEFATCVDETIHNFLGFKQEIFPKNSPQLFAADSPSEILPSGYLWEKAFEISSHLMNNVFIFK